MNFKGHLTTGILVGTGVGASSYFLSQSPQELKLHLSALGMPFHLFCVTVAASLFPDLDITSVPQRWFFRAIAGVLLYLAWQREYGIGILIALIAITPLLGKHRGWTHHPLAPLVFPAFLMLLYHAVLEARSLIHDFSMLAISNHLKAVARQWPYFLAATIGWYAHLLIDSSLFSFFRRKK